MTRMIVSPELYTALQKYIRDNIKDADEIYGKSITKNEED